MTTPPLVELRDVRKSFDQNEVLRGVSLALRKSTTLAVMGGSGAGKTVLLRIVAGLVGPEVVFFDEPTAGLDPTNARLVAELIAELRKGVCDTAIVVTHDVEFAEMVADQMAILHQGRIAEMGTPAAVRASANPDVRRFLAGELRET